MKKRIILIACALAAGLGPAAAQQIVTGGRVITGPDFISPYKLLFSQNDYVYGTSRTAAMGGAFTSLGADLSSMNINPAGLGMYQSSDWGITQSLSVNAMKTGSPNMTPGTISSGGNRVSYGLNNVAMAYNLFNRSKGLTSLTVGFGFNRAANFNSRSYISTTGERTSIAEMFQNQLQLMRDDTNTPIYPEDLASSKYPFENGGIYTDEWGAVLGYQTGLVGYSGGQYNMRNGLTPANVEFQSITKGGIYEYSLSLGANVGNILYLGATLGIQQINYTEETSYEEYYSGAVITDMWYDQNTKITGSGFTMKLGAILRPVSAMRIGLAFHLPTYYTVEKSYNSTMFGGTSSANSGSTLIDERLFNTAPRLLAGISYVIADRAILAADYERVWNNKISERSSYANRIDESRQESANLYKPSNTVRAGLEILASDVVSVRAGGGYQMDFMQDKNAMTDTPFVKSSWSVTGGLGFNVGRNAYVDLSYLFNRASYTHYDLFYFRYGDDLPVSQFDGTYPENDTDRFYIPRKNLHQITLTIGSRF